MRFLWTSILILVPAAASVAQPGSSENPPDTAGAGHIVILDPGISSGQPTLLLPSSLAGESMFTLPFFSLPLAGAGSPPPFLDVAVEHKLDLLLPLRLEDAPESGTRTVRMVLGSVQLAGAAYIAYRHIKKYGLIK